MHGQALQWVASHATFKHWPSVLEIGSRNLNGAVRHLFGGSSYWGIDIEPGEGVDEVADARIWTAPHPFDLVVCCEVFEHVEDWPMILATIAASLHDGGNVILTMAGPGRGGHSGREPGPLQPGEFYADVDPVLLVWNLATYFTDWTLDYIKRPGDLRVFATK